MKFADNLLKDFAYSISIIASCTLSIFFFHVPVSLQFLFGSVIVMIATVMYSTTTAKVVSFVGSSGAASVVACFEAEKIKKVKIGPAGEGEKMIA